MQKKKQTKMNNQQIIESEINRLFGMGAYDKIKKSQEAVEIILNYITNSKKGKKRWVIPCIKSKCQELK